jgi:putative ATP-binding cassette transporter
LEDGANGTSELLLKFLVLWLVYGCCCISSEFLLIRLAEKTAFRLKLALSRQILDKELRELEKIGEHRLFAVLVEDISTITSLVGRLPNAFINSAIVAGCYGYMLWLSPPLFLFNICFLACALTVFFLPARIAKRRLAIAREVSDSAVRQFQHLTRGLKELILHAPKRRQFLSDHLHADNERLMDHNISSKTIYIVSQRFGDLLILANIGCIVFLLPAFYPVDGYVLTGFVLACMFSLSPLSTLISFVPQWGAANVALEKVHSFGFHLFDTAGEGKEPALPPDIPSDPSVVLTFENIEFEYQDEMNDDRFVVGPVSFRMCSGELTFLVGGNGSGKTTLAKVICGLYPPLGGSILWNGEPVTDHNRNRYYQNFSVVFSDDFLFRHLMGIDEDEIERNARGYLETLRLERKVHLQDGAFSTAALSSGQRKRLALMTACLEDRPVYLFDEWAAGQDPSFKKIFYEEILLDLKKKKKMVLVITHDDSFFEVADRLIKLEDGKISHSSSH